MPEVIAEVLPTVILAIHAGYRDKQRVPGVSGQTALWTDPASKALLHFDR